MNRWVGGWVGGWENCTFTHPQNRGFRTDGKELEDGEHTAGGDIVAVDEAQGVGDGVPMEEWVGEWMGGGERGG